MCETTKGLRLRNAKLTCQYTSTAVGPSAGNAGLQTLQPVAAAVPAREDVHAMTETSASMRISCKAKAQSQYGHGSAQNMLFSAGAIQCQMQLVQQVSHRLCSRDHQKKADRAAGQSVAGCCGADCCFLQLRFRHALCCIAQMHRQCADSG